MIRETSKRKTKVELLSISSTSPPEPEIHIASAIPKGERADWIVEKCSELGARSLSWIICERSQDHRKDHSKRFARWNKISQEAARQSHHSWLPRVPRPTLTRRTTSRLRPNLTPTRLRHHRRDRSTRNHCASSSEGHYSLHRTRRWFHRHRARTISRRRMAISHPRSLGSSSRDRSYRRARYDSEFEHTQRSTRALKSMQAGPEITLYPASRLRIILRVPTRCPRCSRRWIWRQQSHPNDPEERYLILIGLTVLGLSAAQSLVFSQRGARTLGRRITGIIVVSADGLKLSWIRRWLRFPLACFSWGFGGLGILWVLIDPMHRSWHDIFTGTVEVPRLIRVKTDRPSA